jgi:2-polyprenyl-3-methyl-5-hydroxy-6-metoxy-1,4-benzoquinol methylase
MRRLIVLEDKCFRQSVRPLSAQQSKDFATMRDPYEVSKRSFERPQWYLTDNAFNIRIRIETILEFTRNVKFESILDIGCGDGSLSLPLLTKSNRITFLDRSKSMLELVQSRIPSECIGRAAFVNLDFMDACLREESFDLIICVGVMAYIADRRSAIKKIAALLRPGGTLIIECSDGEHWYTRMNRSYEAFRVKLGRADFPTVARPASELIELLEKYGLEQGNAFRYSLPPHALRRFLSQRASYNLIRLLFGTAGRNRAACLGNECLFQFKHRSEADEGIPRLSPSAKTHASVSS